MLPGLLQIEKVVEPLISGPIEGVVMGQTDKDEINKNLNLNTTWKEVSPQDQFIKVCIFKDCKIHLLSTGAPTYTIHALIY